VDMRAQWMAQSAGANEATSADVSLFAVCPPLFPLRVRVGQTTANFARHPAPDLARSSFSILYDMGRSTLDVIAKDPNDYTVWVRGLRELMRISSEGRPGDVENLKTLPLQLGILTQRRSSVDIRDMNTGATAAALGAKQQEGEEGQPGGGARARAMSTGNKGMYKEVAVSLNKLKAKLQKRREELRASQYYLSPQYDKMQVIVKRVQESVNKCADLFQDGEYRQ